MDRRPRVDWGVMGGELIVACAVWVFFYWLWLGLYEVRPGHLGDILFARVLVPAAIPLFLLAQIHETWNHASVVFNDESISKATWLGRYGVKTLRWEDIERVHTYRVRGAATYVYLHALGGRIFLRPEAYADRQSVEAALAIHLQHVPEHRRTGFGVGGS